MSRLLGNAYKSCGPSRTEAEHPQPGFGLVDGTNSTAIFSAFALLTIFHGVKRDNPFATTPNERSAHLVFRMEKILLNRSFTWATLWRQVTLDGKRCAIATARRQEKDKADNCDLMSHLVHEC